MPAMAERVEEAKLHGVEMHGYQETPWYWHTRFEGHGGRDFNGLWCDGEHLVQLAIDIYGNGYMSIASVDWFHGSEDCECDACLAALADTDERSE
jgi:prepilin-type processing-associated H-X9-DG protein